MLLLAIVKVFLTPAGLTLLGVPVSNSAWTGVCVCIALLWLMIKLPGLMKRFVLGPRQGRGLVGQVIGAVITIKTLGAVTGIGGSVARSRVGSRRGTAPPPSGGAGLSGGSRPTPPGGGPLPAGPRCPTGPTGPRRSPASGTGHPGTRDTGPVWRTEPDRTGPDPTPTPPPARAGEPRPPTARPPSPTGAPRTGPVRIPPPALPLVPAVGRAQPRPRPSPPRPAAPSPRQRPTSRTRPKENPR